LPGKVSLYYNLPDSDLNRQQLIQSSLARAVAAGGGGGIRSRRHFPGWLWKNCTDIYCEKNMLKFENF